jgi:CBS domain-containing protein
MHEILSEKGQAVHSISPEATLSDVVDKLVARNCGSLVVLEGDCLKGIITERDILRTCAADHRPLSTIHVRECMTTELITGTPEDEVNTVMGMMTDNHVRHLPILENEKLVGIISIGDVVKAQFDKLSMENHYLKRYIQTSS